MGTVFIGGVGFMWDLMDQGGWMMYPLLLTSLVVLTVIFERTYVILVQTKGISRETLTHLYELIKHGRLDEGRSLLAQHPSSFSAVFLAILNETDETHQEKAAAYTGDDLLFGLQRRLSILSAAGSLAPLMGLLGTVLGMIEVFANVASLGETANASMLAGGIWEALLTTATGMAIAIPALIAYHYLHRHVDDLAHRLQHDSGALIALLSPAGSCPSPQ